VGAPLNDSGYKDAGWCSVLDGSTGKSLRSLPNPVPFPGDNFGRSLAAAAPIVFVGTPGTTEVSRGGAVQLMNGETTAPLGAPIRNPNGMLGDQFGFSLAASATLLVVGAPTADVGETDGGAVYLYRAR